MFISYVHGAAESNKIVRRADVGQKYIFAHTCKE